MRSSLRLWLLPLALGLMAAPLSSEAFGGHGHGRSSSSSKSKAKAKKSKKCTTCARDSHGKIKRSAKAKDDFMRQTGYPQGRKGYIVDHVVPLECGGADVPSNMQWQTVSAAKAKDRTERNCH